MSDRAIQEAIQILSGTHLADKVYAVDARVISVNESERNCRAQLIGGRANNIISVRLMTVVDDGLLIIPSLDSVVSVIMSDFSAPYISQYSEIDKIIFRGGDLGGLIKINELTGKLNAMVAAMNVELGKIATGIIAGGGAYTPENLQQFNKADYENTKIEHG